MGGGNSTPAKAQPNHFTAVNPGEKARDCYGSRNPGPPEAWLFDIVRATVLCNAAAEVDDLFAYLAGRADASPESIDLVSVKNRCAQPQFTGYRDVSVKIRLHDNGGWHVCELQLHLKAIYDIVHSAASSTRAAWASSPELSFPFTIHTFIKRHRYIHILCSCMTPRNKLL